MKWWFLGLLVLVVGCTDDEVPADDDGGSGGNTASSSSTGAGGTGTGGMAGTGGSGGATSKPRVRISTSMGDMVIELEPDLMPITTSNFLAYVDDGFYSNTIIHRVIPDFVIQGGGFTSGLTSKPATRPAIQLETSAEVLHDYGAISMARTNDPNSATTQFFVVNSPTGASSLDGQYAAFGHMIEGNAALDAISAVMTGTQGQFEDVPVQEVVVTSITRE